MMTSFSTCLHYRLKLPSFKKETIIVQNIISDAHCSNELEREEDNFAFPLCSKLLTYAPAHNVANKS